MSFLRSRNIKIISIMVIIFFALNFLASVTSAKVVPTSVTVVACQLTIRVEPEKRVNASTNLQTDLNVEIYSDEGDFAGEFDLTTNNEGYGSIDLCDEGVLVSEGNYDFYIKGESHLRRRFADYAIAPSGNTEIDFTQEGPLFAGETSNIYDNIINTLDISTQASRLETAAAKYDLNKDGKVNIMDVSITITNYNTKGNCSPNEVTNSICTN